MQGSSPHTAEDKSVAAAATSAGLPLCVDLDGSLVATDTLWESVLLCLRVRPLALLHFPGWLLRGRSHVKQALAGVVKPDPAVLPYREEVLAYLREAREAGRPVVLATASDRSVAQPIADHVGLFTSVIASDGSRNLKGRHKREALEAAFGPRGFEYLGDSSADLAVWSGAAQASCVGLTAARRERVAALAPIVRDFAVPGEALRPWLRALRVHQWVKNLLVFLPLLMAHRFDEVALVGRAALAFLAMSLCASSVYLWNDLMDLTADRAHPRKRSRPFAAGTLPIASGVAVAPLLVLAAVGLSLALLPGAFTTCLAAYLASSVLYNFALKSVAIADVIFLAGLYSLRILAGGFATEVEVSPWLLGFSLFFFLNLAFLKRYAELRLYSQEAPASSESPGRDYARGDAPLLLSLGPASGYMAAVVLALYIQSEHVRTLYAAPELLWLLVPILVFWIGRMWMTAHRGRMTDDPILFTTRDAVSYGVGAAAAGVMAVAALLHL